MSFSADTVAVSMYISNSVENYTQEYTNTLARVKFIDSHNYTRTPIDAVYCEDLYSKEIEAESSGKVSTNDYTRTFAQQRFVENSRAEMKWICPNITSEEFSYKHDYLEISVQPCSDEAVDVYADGIACG